MPRFYFSDYCIQSASLFARLSGRLELEYQDEDPVGSEVFIQHRAFEALQSKGQIRAVVRDRKFVALRRNEGDRPLSQATVAPAPVPGFRPISVE